MARTSSLRMSSHFSEMATAWKSPLTVEALEATVKAGFPVAAVDEVAERTGYSIQEVLEVAGLSERTYARRKVTGLLTTDESDRVGRLLRLRAVAEAVIGSGAQRWLHQPNRALDGRTPLQVAATEMGAALVFDVLGRIEHGVFA